LWNDREFGRILSERITEDVEWVTVPTGQTFGGHEGMREFTQGWVDAFLDGSTEDTTAYAGEIISGHTLRFPRADGTVGGGRFAGTVSQPRLPTSCRTLVHFCRGFKALTCQHLSAKKS
jgi:hypothetical protein